MKNNLLQTQLLNPNTRSLSTNFPNPLSPIANKTSATTPTQTTTNASNCGNCGHRHHTESVFNLGV
jgi:hypothetical protein